MLDLTQLQRSKAARRSALWTAARIGLFGVSAAAFTGAMLVAAHAQRAPDPPLTLTPLPTRPQQVAVQLPSDPFEPLVTTALTIHRNGGQLASQNSGLNYGGPSGASAVGAATAVIRLCTTFMTEPRSAIIQVDSSWLTVDLTHHSRLGAHRVVAIGANALELDNGTIIQQADCAGAATPQPSVDQTVNTNPTYQENGSGILVPGPEAAPATPQPGPYDRGPDNPNTPQQNNPYNNLYGQTPPPQQGFPPFVRTLPGSPAQNIPQQ